MCGIGGVVRLRAREGAPLDPALRLMNELLAHRGPDGHGVWTHADGVAGFAHRRLSIIDIAGGHQPMIDNAGNVVTYNGEIYNYRELRTELGQKLFRTSSDTEVILHGYQRWGAACVERFRGMFAFALWDERAGRLFCGRDRFGIKPFYYAVVGDTLYFASEAKALLPFVGTVETDHEAFKEYLAFQLCLEGKTLFKGIRELPPGCTLVVEHGTVRVQRYWEVYYEIDWNHTARYFEEKLRHLLQESVTLHLRSDVPLGAYISGGLDSGVVAAMASDHAGGELLGFTGKFSIGPEYDESHYAREVATHARIALHELDISVDDFIANVGRLIYHMDYPAAGPGAFPQFMVSQMAARYRKVVLGGQGGDEVFGGYTRYLIAYFEQCIKAAIEGTIRNGRFVVTYESIIPNLVALKNYQPMLREFWREGLFEPMDARYFRLINRAPDLGNVVRWELLGDYSPFETFQRVFHGENVGKESYFDLMTHFDFKTLLPALLQVEDRVSMAHGLEARVPLLDHPLVEVAATIPADVKFKNGHMKHVFRQAYGSLLPPRVVARTDKMGFPTPLTEWVKGPAREFVMDVFTSEAARSRPFVNNGAVVERLGKETKFGRSTWGLLCLELWHQTFVDRAHSALPQTQPVAETAALP